MSNHKDINQIFPFISAFLFIFALILTQIFIIALNSNFQDSIYESIEHKLQPYQKNSDLSHENMSKYRKDIVNYYDAFIELDKTVFSQKEIQHYSDVELYFRFLILLIPISILLLLLPLAIYLNLEYDWKSYLKSMSTFSIIILILLALILVYFETFWNDILHPLLFDNLYYINTPNEVSYYLYPEIFFEQCIKIMYGITSLICFILFLISRKLDVIVREIKYMIEDYQNNK